MALFQLGAFGVGARIKTGQIRVLSITDLQFIPFSDIIIQKQNI